VSLTVLTSLAGARSSRTARASVAHSTLVVAGKPFFPVMLIDQCTPQAAAQARRLGVNLIVNESCPSLTSRRQLAMLNGHALAVLSVANPTVRGGGLVGWTFPDEPENNGWTPEKLKHAHPYARGSSDGLISFMTTGAGFFDAAYARTTLPRSEYGRFARLADVAGFDLYPLGHCSDDLSAVYNAQRAFNRLAGRMPTFQWIETGPIKPGYCGGFQMQPAELRAEVWAAIAGGARGIGYFTHTWTPVHNAFDVTPAIEHEIARTNSLIAAVRPGLVGRTLLSGSNSPSMEVLARAGGGKVYVFVVNPLRQPATIEVHVPALRTGPINVFGERRTVSVNDARFQDSFAPLGVHVYVQSRKG
jgi:hypothetical protein